MKTQYLVNDVQFTHLSNAHTFAEIRANQVQHPLMITQGKKIIEVVKPKERKH